MRPFLIATAALSLMGGAAFAQTGPSGPAADTTPSAAQPAGAPNTAPTLDSTSSGSMTSGATTSAAPATDTATASAAQTTDAPTTYPVCTSKHEDHCVNRSQATREAKLATRHQKMDNVQPAG